MWQDDVIPSKSLEEEGWKHKESATQETEVSEASELQSPVDLACPMRQESEGFWRPVVLAHQRWESEGFWKSSRPGLSSPSDGRRVEASGKVAQPT